MIFYSYTLPHTSLSYYTNLFFPPPTATIVQMRLRARIIRKERAIGVIPGGDAMTMIYPKGHGR